MKERSGQNSGAMRFFYDKNRKAVIEALPTHEATQRGMN
jgi:hypothetical protein